MIEEFKKGMITDPDVVTSVANLLFPEGMSDVLDVRKRAQINSSRLVYEKQDAIMIFGAPMSLRIEFDFETENEIR